MPERLSRSAAWERQYSSNKIPVIFLSSGWGCVWKPRRALLKSRVFCGGLAQLGERIVRNDEAGGSNPLPSTKFPKRFQSTTQMHRSGRYNPAWARNPDEAKRKTHCAISFPWIAGICNSRPPCQLREIAWLAPLGHRVLVRQYVPRCRLQRVSDFHANVASDKFADEVASLKSL
jgi:hypothetical protein